MKNKLPPSKTLKVKQSKSKVIKTFAGVNVSANATASNKKQGMQQAQGDLKNAGKNSRTIIATQFNGPIPPPAILQGYKDVQEDAPERILRMAEKDQEYTHKDQEYNHKFKYRHFSYPILIYEFAIRNIIP